MTLSKVLVVTIITAAATSAATFFGLRALTGAGLSGQVPVPAVTGLKMDEARAVLEGRRLLLGIADTVEDVRLEAGRVVHQSPPAGSMVPAGSEVRVVLSAGRPKVNVPSVLNLPLATATELLTGVGLRPGGVTRREDARVPAEQVIASQPPPGQLVPVGSIVELTVSSGSGLVKVPSLLGHTQAQATQLLEAVGLKTGRVSFGYDEDRRAGVVIRQTPAADAGAERGSAVNLVLNEGD